MRKRLALKRGKRKERAPVAGGSPWSVVRPFPPRRAALISRSQRSQVLGSHQTAEKSEGHDRCCQGLAENLVLRVNEGKGRASGGFGGRAAGSFEWDDLTVEGIGDGQAVHDRVWVEVVKSAWVVLPKQD